jgi:succinate dehydrogenase / fumarate reductase iron-sulfur subunit
MAKNISFTIKFWRQNGPKDAGHFDTHEMHDIPDDTSFLEMLDILNEELINEGKEPFVFDHDCREGICGMCSLYINGTPHGKTERGATTCQLYMRRFNDGDVITVEPWRSAAFPVIKDCMVDRNAFDKIIQAGGYTTIRTGQAQDANAILIPKEDADEAMDCASCIGCGACVAACKNGSAMLFVSSKVSQLGLNHLAVHAGDVGDGLILRAYSLASAGVGAITEAEFVHLGNHVLHTTCSLYAALRKQGELRNLRADEQHS